MSSAFALAAFYSHLFVHVLFIFLVKAAVLDFSSVTSTEDELVLLRCRAIGDPAPQMTIRKSSHTEPYQLGSSVSLDINLFLLSQ